MTTDDMTTDDLADTPDAKPSLPLGPDGLISLSGMASVSSEAARKLSDAGWGGVAGGASYVMVEIPRSEESVAEDADGTGAPQD